MTFSLDQIERYVSQFYDWDDPNIYRLARKWRKEPHFFEESLKRNPHAGYDKYWCFPKYGEVKEPGRRFFKTEITVTVISEEPIPGHYSLHQTVAEGMDGKFIIYDEHRESRRLSREETVMRMKHAGYEPSFFNLDKEGNSND